MKTIKRYLSILLTLSMMWCGFGVVTANALPLNENTIFDENIISVETNDKEELQPLAARSCPVYVPGIGYTGSAAWNSAIATVQAGGNVQGWGSNNLYLSEANARMLLNAAGCQVYGDVEQAHANCHNYPHLHYWANGTRHNTIRLG